MALVSQEGSEQARHSHGPGHDPIGKIAVNSCFQRCDVQFRELSSRISTRLLGKGDGSGLACWKIERNWFSLPRNSASTAILRSSAMCLAL